MATPQSTASDEAGKDKNLEQITFRFCSECSNMLYPKEDEDAHKLQFTCRTCQYTEEAQSTCVFRNNLNTSAGETAGVTQDVGSDPTVSATTPPVLCLACGVVIYCSDCFEPCIDPCIAPCATSSADVDVDTNTAREDSRQSMGLCHFSLSWDNADPFAEYDEEMMYDRPDADEASDSQSDTSERFCEDGAMLVEL